MIMIEKAIILFLRLILLFSSRIFMLTFYIVKNEIFIIFLVFLYPRSLQLKPAITKFIVKFLMATNQRPVQHLLTSSGPIGGPGGKWQVSNGNFY